MTLDSVRYFANLAASKWEQSSKSTSVRAEDAWFVLFSLRVNIELLPEDVREPFLEVWQAYGGGEPAQLTRRDMQRALATRDGRGLHVAETMTRDFALNLPFVGIENFRAG